MKLKAHNEAIKARQRANRERKAARDAAIKKRAAEKARRK